MVAHSTVGLPGKPPMIPSIALIPNWPVEAFCEDTETVGAGLTSCCPNAGLIRAAITNSIAADRRLGDMGMCKALLRALPCYNAGRTAGDLNKARVTRD